MGVPADSLSVLTVIPSGAEVTLEFESTVPFGHPVRYLWVRGPDREAAVAALVDETDPAVRVLDQRSESTLLRTGWREFDGSVVDHLESSDGCLLSAQCTGGEWTLRIRFPDSDAVSTFYEVCAAAGLDVTVLDISGPVDRHGGDVSNLSPTQRETLRIAFEAGYFEVPRKTSIRELAAELGVSEQSVSERLRRGLTSLVESTVLADERDVTDKD